MNLKARAADVLTLLRRKYPAPRTLLTWKSPWELLVATILSAQSTDKQVNLITPELFRKWPGPRELARADAADVERTIRAIGLFRNKAKNIVAAAIAVVRAYGGEVPQSMDELVTLPGVGRKTANIVLSNAFEIHEGIAVDTHVRRTSYRLGLTTSRDPVRIETDLMPLFPRKSWGEINHLLVFHGRDTCRAAQPLCPACILDDICPKKGLQSAP
ncbi:MAG: endonuclease III [Desulfovibrionales bacterium]